MSVYSDIKRAADQAKRHADTQNALINKLRSQLDAAKCDKDHGGALRAQLREQGRKIDELNTRLRQQDLEIRDGRKKLHQVSQALRGRIG